VLGIDVGNIPDEQAQAAEQGLPAEERHAALREEFTHMPPPCQHLLTHDALMSYAQISATLDIPSGSIGPICSCRLQQLRSDPTIEP
jgi:DNA-directed RNA polymerase specialized sigma24 family protein